MRNGTFPARILYAARQRNMAVIQSADLVGQGHSPQSVSRAMRRLVQEHQLEPVGRGAYRLLPNTPPALAFNRAWSNPGATMAPDKMIAVTLARPTLRDVARLCKAYGVSRVRQVLESLVAEGGIPLALAADWRHRLDNIERGFCHAAARLSAR
jgi:hypothetical protein